MQIFSFFLIKNIKYFFLGNLVFITFIVIDLIIQYKTGENIFGFKPQLNNYRFTGIFNDEIVAGGFIFLFGFLGLSYFLTNQRYNLFFLFLSFFSFGIILTGDRSPLIMIFLIIFFNLIFNKYLRKYFLFYFLILFTLVTLMIFTTEKSYNRYIEDIHQILDRSQPSFTTEYWHNRQERIVLEEQLLNEPKDITIKEKIVINKKRFEFLKNLESIKNNSKGNFFKESLYNFRNTIYGAHYLTAINIIKDNPVFGSGIRTFRIVCLDYENEILSFNRKDGCSTHPHNLHLEIISEIGFIGYIFFITMIVVFFYNIVFSHNQKEPDKTIAIYLLSLMFAVLFPFKPSGSIFSSWLGSQIWLLVAINYLFIIKDKEQL
ncbi:O-antigen ligase family protein [Candidatus Pelagibacter sp. HIMB1542]|uniref:O-antigen ligase family protein n=1 Tax=Candidatus Pelagibacter sp. HIMB1542 TaxID=3413346 RepID=UPI003F8633FF